MNLLGSIKDFIRIRNSCIVDTTYALLLYLLYMPLSKIERTRFFVGSVVPSDCDKKLGSVVRFDTVALKKKITLLLFLKTWMRCIYLRIFLISFTKVYGQDHIGIFGFLTGFKSYVLLEDAPGVYKRLLNHTQYFALNRKMNIFELGVYVIRYGMLPSNTFGQCESCIGRIITSKGDVDSPLIANRNYELVNINSLWSLASAEKKEYVMNVFGVTDSVVSVISGCDTIFLTQPFREECSLTDEEWQEVVDLVVSRYSKNLLIKVHPRDMFDYERHYPYLHVMRSPIPMQLLVAMGATVKRAVTINSSAIDSFPDCVEKISLGARVNEKIRAFCEAK